jgi:HK97 family phage portal protein
MRWWQRFVHAWRAATYRNPPDWLVDAFSPGLGRTTDSGVRVGTLSAFFYSSWWAATNLIAGDLGKLPLILHRVTSDGKEPAENHPAHRLMTGSPNEYLTSGNFKELLTMHAICYGNGRAGITRDGRGQPMELVPFLPDRSWEEVLEDGAVVHMTKLGDDKEPTPFPDRDVLHIRGLSYDGVTGFNMVNMARNSIGLGLAAEKHGNRMFRNQVRPSIVLESDQRFSREDALQLMADWHEMNAGVDNAGRTALLQGGVKAHTVSQQNDHAQWNETRKLQRQEVAAWFGIPPHKIGDDSRTSYGSLEEENRQYVQSLGQWFRKWEEECWLKLLTEDEKRRRSHYWRWNTDDLVRGDVSTRYAAYQVGIQSEFLSPNEARSMEDLNRREGGDEFKNPNTSSPDSAAGDESPPEDDDARPEARIVRNRITRFVEGEVSRLAALADTCPIGSFGDRLPGVLDRIETSLVDVLKEFGAPAELAEKHRLESENRITNATRGVVARRALQRKVSDETKTWKTARAGAISRAVLESLRGARDVSV